MKKRIIAFLIAISFMLSSVGCSLAKSDFAPKSPMDEVKEDNNLSPIKQ